MTDKQYNEFRVMMLMFKGEQGQIDTLAKWVECLSKEEYQKGYKQGSIDTQSVVKKMIDLEKEIGRVEVKQPIKEDMRREIDNEVVGHSNITGKDITRSGRQVEPITKTKLKTLVGCGTCGRGFSVKDMKELSGKRYCERCYRHAER